MGKRTSIIEVLRLYGMKSRNTEQISKAELELLRKIESFYEKLGGRTTKWFVSHPRNVSEKIV